MASSQESQEKTTQTQQSLVEEEPSDLLLLPRRERALKQFTNADFDSTIDLIYLYVLCDIPPADLDACLAALKIDADEEYANFALAAPRWNFAPSSSGERKTIRDVYDAHVANISNHVKNKKEFEFSYEWFAILLDPNWEGRNFFTVTLDEQETGEKEGEGVEPGNGVVDTCLLTRDELMYFAPNMMVRNMGFHEFRRAAEGKEDESDVLVPRVRFVDPETGEVVEVEQD